VTVRVKTELAIGLTFGLIGQYLIWGFLFRWWW